MQARRKLWVLVICAALIVATPLLLHANRVRVARNLEAERAAVSVARYVTASIEEDQETIPGRHEAAWVIKNHTALPAYDLRVRHSCKQYFTPNDGTQSSTSGEFNSRQFDSSGIYKSSACSCDSSAIHFGKAYSQAYKDGLHCREDLAFSYTGYSGRSYGEKHCYYVHANERKEIDCSLPDDALASPQSLP